MAEEAKREDEDAKWEREKREKEERDERKKSRKGMMKEQGDLAARIGHDSESNEILPKGNAEASRHDLKIPRRKEDDGGEEGATRGSADSESEKLMQATDGGPAEEIGVVIHDDD